MTILARKLHLIDYFALGFGVMVGAAWLRLRKHGGCIRRTPAFRLDFNSPRPTLNCEDMQNIAAPALVLAGAERVAQCLKGRSLAKIPQGTHHSQLNHSQEFNDTVLAFLAKH